MKGIPKYPGIVRHARALGVTTRHLLFVLEGARPSPELLERYRAIVAAEASARVMNFPKSGTVLEPGTVFSVGTAEAHRRLAAEHSESLRMHGDLLEVIKQIVIRRPFRRRITEAQQAKIVELRREGKSYREIQQVVRIPIISLYRVLRSHHLLHLVGKQSPAAAAEAASDGIEKS